MSEEKLLNLDFLNDPTVLYITLVRFVGALLILYEPLPGVIISFFLDMLDSHILIRVAKLSENQYQFWDKNIDWIIIAAEMTIAAQYGLYFPFVLLLLFRFIGHVLFMRSFERRFLMLFPNIFEAVFLWLIIFFPLSFETYTSVTWYQYAILIGFVLVKVLQEVLLHIVWPQYAPMYTNWEAKISKKLKSTIYFSQSK